MDGRRRRRTVYIPMGYGAAFDCANDSACCVSAYEGRTPCPHMQITQHLRLVQDMTRLRAGGQGKRTAAVASSQSPQRLGQDLRAVWVSSGCVSVRSSRIACVETSRNCFLRGGGGVLHCAAVPNRAPRRLIASAVISSVSKSGT